MTIAPLPDAADLLARRARLLGPAYRVLYEEPLHPVRGEGVWLVEANGRRILDVYNNVPSVGHCHPRVVEALARQAAILNTHTRYLHETVLDYAERLLALFPAELSQVMFTCTGSEANDLAVRVARTVTGNEGFIVTANAYHGVTAALAEMSPSLGLGVGRHVRTVPAPDSYRVPAAEIGARFQADVEAAIASLAEAGIKPAALLFDTVFASDGLFVDPAGFVTGAVQAVRGAGGLFIADEVQAGLARMGSHMWGFERHALVPDLVTLGKPMGDGHPIAAMIARPALLEEFGRRSRYFNTFGGNPVSAAVGLAVLDVVRDEELLGNARRVGAHLLAGLEGLKSLHESVGDVRGAGLYAGIEMVSDRPSRTAAPKLASLVVNGLRREGVLVGLCGAQGQGLKIRPPLPFSTTDADHFLERLDEVLAKLPA
ncbi:aspartate aminotransferase family protein [Aureimonas sp. AU12]|uniref:aspartate aminotransferase family protein n=1 Tax=Aureimonas sp. AU12 TaxID=1638161 RepID=UPI000784D414|nr:aminotransferase class III-fold pyridoxal phosphate-dependent enzyme [Aureimonas sp. AU12]